MKTVDYSIISFLDYEGMIGMVVIKYESYTKMRPYWRAADHVWGILCEKGLTYNIVLLIVY